MARLLGSAHTIRERITEPGSPNRRATLEAVLESARASLGESYDAIWAAGAAATPAQAAADALADDEPVGVARAGAQSAPSAGADALSIREREIVALVSSGLANADIATTLVVSRRTVEWHVGNILGKLGLQTRAQLVV